ncbi:hypothetical protein [Mucilaginibacter boryungensis]|uniref:Uncharacterized protein n=1 Tax=Mucilaginibacter boryungensis TaxID=768480 RepID=A0ABR9XGE8_9SPHI|nr:hypothetical protein [Mucilaginibacter boryungensis]MBE9666473.1 hypothetical protein [Mucilaginibacter boryungensis]
MKTTYIKSLFFASLFICACKKDNNTNTDTTTNQITNITYYAKAVNSGALITGSNNLKTQATGSVAWLTGTIYAEELSFEGTGSTVVSTKIPIQKNINILSGDGLAGNVSLTAGQYTNTKVALHLKKSAKSDLAFNLTATYTDFKGNKVPMVIANSDEFEIKLAVSNFTTTSTGATKITISYDLSKILNNILAPELENAYRTPDGTLLISSSVNVDLYNKVKANWQILATASVQ